MAAEQTSKLTAQEIWARIYRDIAPDDRDPRIVITEVYGGNEARYLEEMAHFFGVTPAEA